MCLTQDIRTNVEPDDSVWAVWVLEEDLVSQAKTELEQFRENPDAEKYRKAKAEADALREREIKKHREVKKKVVRANVAWNKSYLERCPVTITLIVMSVAAVIATTSPNHPLDFGQKVEPGLTWLSFAPLYSSGQAGSVEWSGDKFRAILHGEVWRLFTPMFLHFGPLHLLVQYDVAAGFGRRDRSPAGQMEISSAGAGDFGNFQHGPGDLLQSIFRGDVGRGVRACSATSGCKAGTSSIPAFSCRPAR